MTIGIWVCALTLVFVAYFCKGMSGFGSSIIMIAIGSLVIGPLQALVLTAILDVIGGVTLLRLDTTKDRRGLWIPLSIAMLVGAVLGGTLLKFLPLKSLENVVFATLLGVSIWLLFCRDQNKMSEKKPLPNSYAASDFVICLIAGTTGGLTGISAPPLLYHYGRMFTKEATRRILTRVFLVEAITRVVVYSLISVIARPVFTLSLISIPCMFLGLYAGNHAFFRIPEKWFSRITGLVVMAAVMKQLWQRVG